MHKVCRARAIPLPDTKINTALNRVEKSLAACKKDKRVPIIHVEVDVRCNSNLILLKIWGEDLQGIFEIEDYTDEEANQYMHSCVECLEEEFEEYSLVSSSSCECTLVRIDQ